MRILVVESDADLGQVWCIHLRRQGGHATLVAHEDAAIEALGFESYDVLVLDLLLPNSSVLAIADFAMYRRPDIAIIVVTANTFFSDGSIFDVIPNARGFLHAPVQPEDLAALVDHYGRRTQRNAG